MNLEMTHRSRRADCKRMGLDLYFKRRRQTGHIMIYLAEITASST